jgi:hypothetical protein
MKKAILAGLLAGTAVWSSAWAAPITLPTGPLFIQFNDAEQFSPSNSITSGGTREGLWGIMQISVMSTGTVLPPTGSDIAGGGVPFFVQGQNGGNQITGIFYGFTTTGGPAPTTLTGGHLDLYWSDSSTVNVGTELLTGPGADRTSQTTYTGFAGDPGMTLLVSFDFSPGVNAGATLGADTTTTDVAAIQPGTADGSAKSYLDVNLAAGGVWAQALDKDFFTLDALNIPWSAYGLQPKDVRLDTNFSANGASAWSVAGTDIVGLRTNDPARAFAPEPGSLALVGVALAMLGGLRRRSKAEA